MGIKRQNEFERPADGRDNIAIRIAGLYKTFGQADSGLTVLQNIDLTIGENEFVSLVGRSGCGKTTLLNIIAGLERPTSGSVEIHGREVRGHDRDQLRGVRSRCE